MFQWYITIEIIRWPASISFFFKKLFNCFIFGCMAASQLQHARSKLWSGGSSLQCVGLLWLCCMGSRVHGLSGCGAWGLAAPGTGDLSSPTEDQTCVPSMGKQILNHWTTREAHWISFLLKFFPLILPIECVVSQTPRRHFWSQPLTEREEAVSHYSLFHTFSVFNEYLFELSWRSLVTQHLYN